MRFDIITIFPDAFVSYLNTSILKRAQAKRIVDIRIHHLRDFTKDKHKTVDEKPYGGGPGMVIKIEPLARAIGSILKSKVSARGGSALGGKSQKSKVLIIIFSATGKQFDQKMARGFAKKYDRIVMICGHYEGVDERVFKVLSAIGHKPLAVSIGPYVLTGGELPAMMVIDAVSRHIPGVLGKEISIEEKRLGVGIPAYTRPEIFAWKNKKYRVPKILLSGNHAKIEAWRKGHQKKAR